jgi:hypothetical protein
MSGQQPHFTEFVQAIADSSWLLPSGFHNIGAGDASQIDRLSDEYIIDFDGSEKRGNRV